MRTTAVLFILVLAAGALPPLTGSSASSSLAFTHVTLIDVRTGHILPDQTIVITGDRITALSPRARIPANAEVVNATGKFVIPGLWDMHAHALWSNDQIIRMFDLFLANGITGIRDMGSRCQLMKTLSWRTKVANGTLLGPRIFAAGKLVDGPKPDDFRFLLVSRLFHSQLAHDLNHKCIPNSSESHCQSAIRAVSCLSNPYFDIARSSFEKSDFGDHFCPANAQSPRTATTLN
jgi:hypothetical protein